MGRAARWVRSLLGVGGEKKEDNNRSKKKKMMAMNIAAGSKKESVIRRSFGNLSHRRDETENGLSSSTENNNEMIVRRLCFFPSIRSSDSRVPVKIVSDVNDDNVKSCRRRMEWFAALKIQSFFRGYLARKARRALKAIVKLQAVVRGHLVRKQLARTLYTMQVLFNAWSQHCADVSPTIYRTPMKQKLSCDRAKTQMVYIDAVSTSFNGSITTTTESPLIGEVNSSVSKSSNHRFSSSTFSSEDRSCNVPPPIKVRDHRSSSFHVSDETQSARLANKAPRRSDCNPLGSPNYMLCTKSFMAKIKSQSSPRQGFELRRRAFEAEMGISGTLRGR